MVIVDKQQQTEQQVLHANMGLVVSVAKSFKPPNSTELEEYLQEGRIGLLNGIRTYNPDKGKLSTWATHNIRWQIMRYISKSKRNNIQYLQPQTIDTFSTNGREHNRLWEVLPDSLSDNEREIINLKSLGCTLKEAVEIMGNNMTPAWASQVYQAAVKKIRESNDKETHSFL